MFQMATKPSVQPTAMSLGDNHVKHVHSVEGGLAAKTGDSTLSVGRYQRCNPKYTTGWIPYSIRWHQHAETS